MRPDTFHGLVLIVVACCAMPRLAAGAFCLLCAGTAAWIVVGVTCLTLQFFYRGFRYGDWD